MEMRASDLIARAVALGACQYVLKSANARVLIDAVHLAHRRDPAPSHGRLTRAEVIMHREVDAGALPEEMPLTGREAQVLRHMALGLSNKDVAHSLMISVETIEEHAQNILREINAKDRTDAVVRAIRAGLVGLSRLARVNGRDGNDRINARKAG